MFLTLVLDLAKPPNSPGTGPGEQSVMLVEHREIIRFLWPQFFARYPCYIAVAEWMAAEIRVMASHLSQPTETIGDMRALKRRFAGPRFGEQRFGFRHHAQTLKYDGSELTKICAREPLFELVKVGRERE